MPRNVHGFWLQHLNIFRCLYRSLVDTKMMEPQIPACGLEIQPQWQIAVREVPGHSNASVYPWSSCWGFFSPDCQHNCSVFQPCLSTCCALQLHQDWHQFQEIHLGRLAPEQAAVLTSSRIPGIGHELVERPRTRRRHCGGWREVDIWLFPRF